MKQFFVAVLCCIMIGSFFTACATTANDKRGYGGKKTKPRQAQEQVVPSQGQEVIVPKDATSQSK